MGVGLAIGCFLNFLLINKFDVFVFFCLKLLCELNLNWAYTKSLKREK
jgi:hypothetical protein